MQGINHCQPIANLQLLNYKNFYYYFISVIFTLNCMHVRWFYVLVVKQYGSSQ